MTDFRLASIDWESVRLLHGEHLSHETTYVEDLIRWVLHSGLPAGIIHMGPDSLSVRQSSTTTYRVTLRHCRATTLQGYWVHIADEESNPEFDLDMEHYLDQEEQAVGLYLGVDTQEKESKDHAPGRSDALLECSSRWPKYLLDTNQRSDHSDWLQIAQVVNRGGELVLDEAFIPACHHLDSHPALLQAVTGIRDVGARGLTTLAKYEPAAVPENVSFRAGLFASALAPAATVVDLRAGPHAYVERMCSVLRASSSLVRLCPRDTAYRDDAIAAIDKALSHTEGEGDLLLGPTLADIRSALEKLLELYERLAAAPAPTPPPERKDHGERIFRKIK